MPALQAVFALTTPALTPKVLERESYFHNQSIQIALGYGLRWTSAWIEVATFFPIPERRFPGNVGHAARYRLQLEIDEWSQRRPRSERSTRPFTGTTTITLPDGHDVNAIVVFQHGIWAAAFDAPLGRRITVCGTVALPQHLVLHEETDLVQYRQGASADAARRLNVDLDN